MRNEQIGRITEIQKNTIYIKYDGQELMGKLKGSFFANDDYNWPVVGDYVKFDYNPIGESMIYEICERKSILKRPDSRGHAYGFVKNMNEQPMVSNFDYVFIVTALNGNYNFNRVARYVGHTLETNAIPVVVLTKADLCSNVGRYISEIESLSDKVRVHAVSAIYNIGLDELEEYFEEGKTIVLIGSSGAGKSTLVNAIAGKELMATSEIREKDSKGRHTTTYRQLIELENGVTIIDTPGMREIGMAGVENGIDDTFSDIKDLECQCKYSDCKHATEPGCAVKKAIENKELSEERYMLYKSLQSENHNNAKLKKQIAVTKKQLEKYNRLKNNVDKY